MTRALLDPIFSSGERRWGRLLETTVWLASTALLVALLTWAAGPA